MKSKFFLVIVMFSVWMLISSIPMLAVDVNWTCQAPGNWTNINCWNPGTHIPDNDNGSGNSYDVFFAIGGDTSCTINGGTSIQIDSLELSQLTILHLGPDGPGYLTIEGGQVVNNGFINVASNHWDTAFRINGDTSFSSPTGTGAVVIGNDTHHRIEAITAGDRITNEAGHAFQGASYMGYDTVLFTNHGVIQSDIIGAYLLLNPYDTGINYNDGLIDSTIQSICRIMPSTWDNTDGTIHASDECLTEIAGATIYNGEIASDGIGAVLLHDNGHIYDIEISRGILRVPNYGTASGYISGTITNNATIEMVSDHWGSYLRLADDTTLTGTGTLHLGNHGRNHLTGTGTERLTQHSTHSIHGADYLGDDMILFDNQGTITADYAAGVLNLNPENSGTNLNSGLMKAVDQGILQLSDGTWDNTDGIIEAQEGSSVRLYAATVSNGVIRSSGTGVVDMLQQAHVADVTFESGTIRLPNEGGSTAFISGTITNNASLELANDHWGTSLKLGGDTILAGTGTLYIGNYGRNYLESDGNVRLLTNSAHHTIRGGDYLGNDQLLIDNKGTIQADVAGGVLTIDSAETGTSISTGTMKALGQGTLLISTGTWDCDQGFILAESGSAVALADTTVFNADLETRDDGYIELRTGAELADFSVSNELTLQIPDWNTSNISGVITNNGTMNLLGQNAQVFFNLTDATSLNGSGTAIINPHAHLKGTGMSLTNGSDHTLQNNSTDTTIEPDFTNSGILDITTASAATFNGSFTTTTDSTTLVEGTLTVPGGMTVAGTLTGAGTVDAEVTMSAGSILAPGTGPGTLTLDELGMESGAVINYELDTNGDDLVVITGDISLGADITVNVSSPADYLATGEDHIIFQIGQKISEMPTWTINLPPGCTCDGIVREDQNIVLKNVILPYGVRIDMPTMVHIGDAFYVTGLLDNPGAMATDVAVFFILQVFNDFWFYDSWAHYAPPEATDVDFVMMDIAPGTTRVEVLPSFTWPDTGPTAVDGLFFWGAALTSDMTQIDGRFTQVEWGYGP